MAVLLQSAFLCLGVSQGKTKAEALKNIREAIRGYVKVLKKHHQTAPLEALTTDHVEVKI